MTRSMPHRKLAGLLAVVATVGACAGAGLAETRSGAPPSGFRVQPNVVDPLCNGGRGERIAAPHAAFPTLAVASMPHGSTLTALSAGDPDTRTAVLVSVTSRCQPNAAFGRGGVATIAFPARRPARFWGLWIQAIVPRQAGGAIVAGTYQQKWVVGAVTADGQLDRAFGTGGWVALPFPGGVEAALEEPSGRIILAGGDLGGGCCQRNSAVALSARGQIERAFGRSGRADLGYARGIRRLVREPNGNLLALLGSGNNGCWSERLVMLTPVGRPVPGFARKQERFWDGLQLGSFAGNVYVDGTGFGVVGTGQTPCFEGPSSASAHGLIARLRIDGTLASETVRFASPMVGTVEGFRHGHDLYVVTVPYADATRLTVTALRPDGSIDSRFGARGRASIRTPWGSADAALETSVAFAAAGARDIAIVAIFTGSKRSEVQLIRIRL